MDDELVARLRPMLAVAGDAERLDADWLAEIKWDGVRVLAAVDADHRVTLRSRVGNDVTAAYPEVVAALVDRAPPRSVLDGEVVAFDAAGAASFALLQRRMHLRDPLRVRRARDEVPVHLVLFDVLVDAGEVTVRAPLHERRGRLLAAGLHGGALQVPPATADLDAMRTIARGRGEEGVIAKRRDSLYRPGERSHDWIKLPFDHRREVVVGGWRPERHAAGTTGRRLGAVLVGAHDEDGRLRYLGAVGSGLAGRAGDVLLAALRPGGGSPFADAVPHDDARFVVPQVVGAVRHRGLTGDGRLRQPVWLGTRDDVAAADVHT